MQRREFFKNITLTLVVFFLMIVVIEVGYRMVKKKQYVFPQGMFQEDTLLGYRLTPGFQGEIKSSEYTFNFSVNNAGFRDREHILEKPTNTYRILGLGDSFAMGMGVAYEDIFLTQLETRINHALQKTKVEIIKTGVGGYDALEELLFLKERGIKYSPDLVLLIVYENDFSTKTKIPSGPHVIDGYLALSKPERFSFRDFVFRHMRSWGYIAAKMRAIPFFAKKSNDDGTLHFELDSTQVHFSNKETQKIIDITFGHINEMYEIAKRGNARFAVVTIPGSYRINPEKREKLMAQYGLKKEETDFYRHFSLLTAFGKEKGFPVLNVGEILEQEFKKNTPLYFENDQHFTPLGNRIAGEAIETFLRDQNLLPIIKEKQK